MNRRIYSAALLLALTTLSAAAQNLNPSVQVTNEYETVAATARKHDLQVSVPDSVLRFDYDFDYSVFENPYKGAFDFNPYTIGISPKGSGFDSRGLFLRAGAGYRLRPELYAVWSPSVGKKLDWAVCQDLKGYVGNYHRITPDLKYLSDRYFGYDLDENVAVRTRWETSLASYDARLGYEGLFASDDFMTTSFSRISADVKTASADSPLVPVAYSADLGVSYAADVVSHEFGPQVVGEFQTTLAGSARVASVYDGVVEVAGDLGLDVMTGPFSGRNAFSIAVAPHFVRQFGILNLKAGVRADYFTGSGLGLYPDVRLDASFLGGSIKLSAGAEGRGDLNSYSSLKKFDHFFSPAYSLDFQNVQRDLAKFYLGADGHAGIHFTYSLRAGYDILRNAPMHSFVLCGGNQPYLLPSLVFESYNTLFADASALWKSDRLEIAGGLKYRSTNLDPSSPAVNLPALEWNSRAVYNYAGRIYAGVSCDGMTPRSVQIAGGVRASIPFYADLGLYGEYVFANGISLWARGTNILNMWIHNTPYHPDEGVGFTLGVCLNL